MKNISTVEFHTGSKEERLPDFKLEFPHISSRVDMRQYMGQFCPWHWHKPVEMFFIEKGTLEYCTPGGTMEFSPGSGGMVNSNVLHMTKRKFQNEETIQFLHIFDPSFIAGGQGTRIEQRYVMPIITASQLEIIPLYPNNPKHVEILKDIQDSFTLSEQEFGYEIKLREALSELWIQLLALSHPMLEGKESSDKTSDKIKLMMIYIHEHYPEKISIADLAVAAYVSERECFRAFHDCLHVTPMEYIKNYRLQMAYQMLAKGHETITAIGHACGLGSSSYFGKVFRAHVGCTPLEYRQKWQDSDM